MKKLNYLIFSLLIIAGIFSSCTKEEDDAEKFSAASVEENKAVIEDSGTDFVQVMGRMNSIQTVDILNHLADIMSLKDTKGSLFLKDSKLFLTLGTFTAAAGGDKNVSDVFNAMTSVKGLTEDPESIKEFWDESVGTYTWNKTTEDWDEVLGGSKIIFKFPSTYNSTTNDAVFTVSSYTGVKMSNPIDEEYTGDLPTAVNADLKVGTKTLVTVIFGASYSTDGVPQAVASDLIIENFKFEVDVTNDTKVVSVAYKFLENDKVIMNMSANGEGLFTNKNYEANTVTHTETYSYISNYIWNPVTRQYVPVYETYTDEWEETDFEEILKSANVNFQLLNIALKGEINIKDLVDQMKLIDKDLENKVINEETADNRYATKINEYMKLKMVNIEKNEIIAQAEAYVVKEVDYGYTDYYISFKLKFSDNSAIDLETYFDRGFDDFVDEMNDLIDKINTEYNIDVEYVDY